MWQNPASQSSMSAFVAGNIGLMMEQPARSVRSASREERGTELPLHSCLQGRPRVLDYAPDAGRWSAPERQKGASMAEAVLTIQLENTNGVQLIHVSGPLDSVTHDQFRSQLDPLVNESGVRLVLDCTNLTYVNSKGLALLGRYQQITMKNLSFFGVAGLNKRIMKTIELLGLSRIVKIYPTVEEAVEAALKLV